MRCFYSQDFELALPSGHPFPMDKFRVSKDMLLEGGIIRPEEIIEVRIADNHVLQRVHDQDYLRKIYSCAIDRKEEMRLGLPVTPQLYTRSATEVEATRLTCRAALDTFAPDLVIWIAGADNHRNDRFGQMMLSVKDLQRRDEVLLKAFIRNRIPVAVLYGGGYNRQSEFTAKLHRNTVAMAKKIASEYRGI